MVGFLVYLLRGFTLSKSFRKYIGIPYKTYGRDLKGVDCYGLILLIYKEHLGIELPDPNTYKSWAESHEYLNAFYSESENVVSWYHKLWTPIEGVPHPYDVVLIRLFEELEPPSHIGLYIGDGKFIHSMENLPATIHRLDYWKKGIYGIYRYKERVVNG